MLKYQAYLFHGAMCATRVRVKLISILLCNVSSCTSIQYCNCQNIQFVTFCLHYLVRLPIKFDDGNNFPLNSLRLENTNSSNCQLSTSILLPFESIHQREMSTYSSHTLTIKFTKFISGYNTEQLLELRPAVQNINEYRVPVQWSSLMLQLSENICCNIMYSYIWHWNHLSLFLSRQLVCTFPLNSMNIQIGKVKNPFVCIVLHYKAILIKTQESDLKKIYMYQARKNKKL